MTRSRRPALATLRLAVACALIATLGSLCMAASLDPPGNLRSYPDYGDATIRIAWDDVDGEWGYRLFRAEAEGGPYLQIGGDLAPDTTTYLDGPLDPALDYFYLARAYDDEGETDDSNLSRQNFRVIWPNPTGRSLLHNWNETIGVAASAGFHKGCDIQQLGPAQNLIVFPRGGVVVRVGNQGWDNNHIYVEVRIGDELQYDSFNHLDGNNVNALGYDVGDHVYAGQPIVEIGKDYFTPGNVDFVDHVHFFNPTDPITNEVNGSHPLSIFSDDADRDPGESRPLPFDHGISADGPVLYRRQGAAVGEPYLALPLGDDPATGEDEGDVDIAVEIGDPMGNGPTQVPTRIAWWIEDAGCSNGEAAIGSAVTPFVLLRWDDRMYRDEGVDWRHLVDEQQDLAPGLSFGGDDYPPDWNNFKHYLLTHASGPTGEPTAIDPTQYWNTNAADDGSAVTAAGANLAGGADAARAEDARFPDGPYTLHLRLDDLVGSSDSTPATISLENFAPAVVRVTPSLEPDPDSTPGQPVDGFRFDFSEPMDPLTVEAALALTDEDGLALDFSLAWDADGCGLFLAPQMPPAAVWQSITLGAGATDTAGRALDGRFGTPSHDGTSGTAADLVTATFDDLGLAEVAHVAIDRASGATLAALAWTAAPAAELYAVRRGSLSTLSTGVYGSCHLSGLTQTVHDDPDLPLSGEGYFYLVQSQSAAGDTGPLGFGTDGPRFDATAVDCP